MTPLLYIFPVIFLALAIIGFFVNLEASKGKMIFAGVAIALLIILIANEVTVYMQVSHSNKLKDKIEQMNEWKTGQIASMNTLIASLSKATLSEKQKLAEFAHLGWTSSNPLMQEALLADEARLELLDFIPKRRQNVTIQNLPSTVDKMLVSYTLEEMGFIVSAPQTQDKFTTKDTDEAPLETTNEEKEDEPKNNADDQEKKAKLKKPEKKVNALFFGHLVRNNDIKLVLYTMLRAGVELRGVKVFRKQSNENARHIKFAYSKSYDKRATFSVSKIKKTKAFKR